MILSLEAKLIAAGVVLLALFALTFAAMKHERSIGAHKVQVKWDAANAREAAYVAKLTKERDDASAKVVTKYVDRIMVVHDVGKTIIQKVPVYVTAQTDRLFPVSAGFVSVLNAAASGAALPNPTAGFDVLPSPVATSTVAASVAGNYLACRENAEQLAALQSWVRSQQAIH